MVEGIERKTAGLCNRILREYDSRISSRRLFTYKLRNVTVFFIGAIAEVLRSKGTLNGTIKKNKKERELAIVIPLLPPLSSYQ